MPHHLVCVEKFTLPYLTLTLLCSSAVALYKCSPTQITNRVSDRVAMMLGCKARAASWQFWHRRQSQDVSRCREFHGRPPRWRWRPVNYPNGAYNHTAWVSSPSLAVLHLRYIQRFTQEKALSLVLSMLKFTVRKRVSLSKQVSHRTYTSQPPCAWV